MNSCVVNRQICLTSGKYWNLHYLQCNIHTNIALSTNKYERDWIAHFVCQCEKLLLWFFVWRCLSRFLSFRTLIIFHFVLTYFVQFSKKQQLYCQSDLFRQMQCMHPVRNGDCKKASSEQKIVELITWKLCCILGSLNITFGRYRHAMNSGISERKLKIENMERERNKAI